MPFDDSDDAIDAWTFSILAKGAERFHESLREFSASMSPVSDALKDIVDKVSIEDEVCIGCHEAAVDYIVGEGEYKGPWHIDCWEQFNWEISTQSQDFVSSRASKPKTVLPDLKTKSNRDWFGW